MRYFLNFLQNFDGTLDNAKGIERIPYFALVLSATAGFVSLTVTVAQCSYPSMVQTFS